MTDRANLRGMVPRDESAKLGVWLFLGGEVILFTSLILTFVVARLEHGDYTAFRDMLNIPLVGANTLILIVSSYLVVRALGAARHSTRATAYAMLLGVIIAGGLFLAGQSIEWAELFGQGVSVETTYGAYFLTITGIHGTHVLIGIVWASLLLTAFLDDPATDLAGRIEVFGLYWHFVDVVWIILFTLFYLVR